MENRKKMGVDSIRMPSTKPSEEDITALELNQSRQPVSYVKTATNKLEFPFPSPMTNPRRIQANKFTALGSFRKRKR